MDKELAQITLEQAQAYDREIQTSATNLRKALYLMYSTEGWRVMGFDSWQKYLEDVAARAHLTPKTLRKHARAGLLEAGAGITVGTFSEGVLRPINDTLSDRKGFTAHDRSEALDLAIEFADGEDKLTSTHASTAAYYVYVCKAGAPILESRMKQGKITPHAAKRILDMVNDTGNEFLQGVLMEVSDPGLASTLCNLQDTDDGKEVIRSIFFSGYVPGPNGTQVPISSARKETLLSHLYEPKQMEQMEKRVGEREKLHRVAIAARDFLNQPEFTDSLNWPPTAMDNPLLYTLYSALVDAGFTPR